jgi:hypothetical protein
LLIFGFLLEATSKSGDHKKTVIWKKKEKMKRTLFTLLGLDHTNVEFLQQNQKKKIPPRRKDVKDACLTTKANKDIHKGAQSLNGLISELDKEK